MTISDEEKKEDHEKLEQLLSQESFDQNTNNEIYKLLNKYGYTEETIYALLEGFVAHQSLLDVNIFKLAVKFDLNPASRLFTEDLLSGSIDRRPDLAVKIHDYSIEQELRGKAISEFDLEQLSYINIAKFKMNIAKDIWLLIPWILKNKLRADKVKSGGSKISLSHPLQMITIISDDLFFKPYKNIYPNYNMTQEEVIETSTYINTYLRIMFLNKYYNKVAHLSVEKKEYYFDKEFSDLAKMYKTNQNNFEQRKKNDSIINNELRMLKNLKEHCEGAGCDWINARLQAFEENFPEWQSPISQEPSKKSGTLFSPTTYEPQPHSLWQQFLNYIWPNYYYPRK